MKPSRRILPALAGLAVGSVLLAACAGAPAPAASEGEEITLRFAWWGSDVRHEATQQVIALFEAEHPGIKVEPEYGNGEGYFDKLATQSAGQNAPDVVQMSDAVLAEYAQRDMLLPLGELPEIDMTNLDAAGVATGEVGGVLYALQSGANFPTVMVNSGLLKQAGIELPDDTKWTWDDYQEMAMAVSGANLGAVGTESLKGQPTVDAWLLQNGLSLYSASGDLGFGAKDLEGYFELVANMSKEGASPSPDAIAEQLELPPDQWALTTGKAASGFVWSNALAVVQGGQESPVELLQLPSDNPKVSGMYFRASQYWSIMSGTKHPEAAAELVDFLLNNEDAADILLAERGLPLNTKMRERIADKVGEAEQRLIEFTIENADAFGDAPPVPPAGGGGYDAIMKRTVSDVLFGSITPVQASEQVHRELGDLIAAAR